jgi:hypothetical protein
VNRRGILASCAGRTCTGGLQTRPYKRRQPGWPVLEVLAIAAAALLAMTLAVDLGAALAACSPF